MEWQNMVSKDNIIKWRRHLHQHPELAFKEYETANYICNQLKKFSGLEIHRPSETGIVAVLKGNRPGKVIALRADIDALAIQEEADIEYPSLVEGVSHACGHDCHVAMLLGAVEVLTQMKEELLGTIKFVFQPAEEQPPGGAIDIVRSGILDDVEYVFGLHVCVPVPIGLMMVGEGLHSAAQDIFDLTIYGKSYHGATPEKGIDPIAIGVEVVNSLYHIVPRNVPGTEMVVMSVCKFAGGNTHNVGPDIVEIKGTLRTATEELREYMKNRMQEIVDALVKAHHGTYELSWEGYPSMVHNDEATAIAKAAAKKIVGERMVMTAPFFAGSEDFSYYEKNAKGTYVFMGSGNISDGCTGNHHNPKFKVSEDALPIGSKMYVQMALEALSQYKEA